MDCHRFQARLGLYWDDEVSPDERREVGEHLDACAVCSAELDEIRSIARDLAAPADVAVPGALWSAIEHRLDRKPVRIAREGSIQFFRTPVAKAAAVMFAAGLGLWAFGWLDGGATRVTASQVDFGVLLDALPVDARKAFMKFLVFHDARESSPHGARQYAPDLNFGLPEDLPGGFRLEEVYLLRFGKLPGVAATYGRDDDFVGVVFHEPTCQENFGMHRDYPCDIGKHKAQKVSVGEWRLVHLTDPTTCHCVLSRLDEHDELPSVMSAVAPKLTTSSPHEH